MYQNIEARISNAGYLLKVLKCGASADAAWHE